MTADEYRQKAEECRSQAGKASNAVDKAAWLKLAEDWLHLATAKNADKPE
jgi:hypothetical protein